MALIGGPEGTGRRGREKRKKEQCLWRKLTFAEESECSTESCVVSSPPVWVKFENERRSGRIVSLFYVWHFATQNVVVGRLLVDCPRGLFHVKIQFNVISVNATAIRSKERVRQHCLPADTTRDLGSDESRDGSYTTQSHVCKSERSCRRSNTYSEFDFWMSNSSNVISTNWSFGAVKV